MERAYEAHIAARNLGGCWRCQILISDLRWRHSVRRAHRSQVERLGDARERNLSRLINILDQLRVSSFEEAHAVRIARHKGAANVAYALP